MIDYATVIDYATIPDWVREEIDMFVSHGAWPGTFVEAVLSNDLAAAFNKSQAAEWRVMPSIVAYVYNEVPSAAWKSRRAMRGWQEHLRTAPHRAAT